MAVNQDNIDLTPLVVYTRERAERLAELLRHQKIACRLVSLPQKGLVRIDVDSACLSKSVTLLEGSGPFAPALVSLHLAGTSPKLLIPVDFSKNSMFACSIGFRFAQRLGLHPVILHAYPETEFLEFPFAQSASDDGFSSIGTQQMEMEAEMEMELEYQADTEMRKFASQLRQARLDGEIPDLRFSAISRPGLPEKVIREYVKAMKPALIVMATRGNHKKHSDMIGSVTAEVVDSCRCPVLAIPEDYDFSNVEDIVKLGFFCSLDASDMDSMEMLMCMFEFPQVEVTLFSASDKVTDDVVTKVKKMRDLFCECYPNSTFNVSCSPGKNLRNGVESFLQDHTLHLLLIPNKKKSVFARLFNPGIAHRILFERDIPMLVLPVNR